MPEMDVIALILQQHTHGKWGPCSLTSGNADIFKHKVRHIGKGNAGLPVLGGVRIQQHTVGRDRQRGDMQPAAVASARNCP